MLFNSHEFPVVFLPLTLLTYYAALRTFDLRASLAALLAPVAGENTTNLRAVSAEVATPSAMKRVLKVAARD